MTISSTLAAGNVIEVDDEAFDRLYGFRSHPIQSKKGRRVAVRVVSQFGEESTKVLTLG
jgi:adenine-specific DNA-methyltransferase